MHESVGAESPDAVNQAAIQGLLQDMFHAAIAVAQPALRIPAFLPSPPRGRTIVIGAGKASAAFSQKRATVAVLSGTNRPLFSSGEPEPRFSSGRELPEYRGEESLCGTLSV